MKQAPSDTEIISHQLMLRAGMVRQLSSGLYTWLPIGLRTMRKVEKIVREEMDRSCCQEVIMPLVQPVELWQTSGRWEQYGHELLRFKDRHKRYFCLGPTHEEVITDMVRREINSYKQLPVNLYQIQTKFRDETRPRFGVMRAREFLMKDAYSFHITQAELDSTYQTMYEAYVRIFTRIGLSFRAVIADNGSIGGEVSHEFHVFADDSMGVIVHSADGGLVAMRGNVAPMASDNEVRTAVAVGVGVCGPIGLEMPIVADCSVAAMAMSDDLRTLSIRRCIEVGHVFQLGQKYATALNATVLDETGKPKPLLMGCYGIGISRVVAAVIEQHHDSIGIIWPDAIAPFEVVLVPVTESVSEVTHALYEKLRATGFDVLLDDRNIRPGAKFADLELIGIPHRIVISDRHQKALEYKGRRDSESTLIAKESIITQLTKLTKLTKLKKLKS